VSYVYFGFVFAVIAETVAIAVVVESFAFGCMSGNVLDLVGSN
jgi:hypothetical protein